MGSEHRRQTLRLLSLLTDQADLPPDSHAWLDWVEEHEAELSWEILAQKHLASLDVGKGRKVVELPEDDGPRVRARPMTKEQQIWDKALSRQGKKKHRRALVLISSLACGILIMGIACYQGYRYWLEKMSVLSTPLDAVVDEADDLPLSLGMLWADHLPRYSPLSESVLGRAMVDGVLSLPMDSSWFDSPPTKAQALLVDAIALERSFEGYRTPSSPMGNFNWQSFPSSRRRWQVQVYMDQAQLSLEQDVSFIQKPDYCEVVVRRTKDKNRGVAHRVFLNDRGLMAWAWRITCCGESLEGQWSRSLSKARAQIQMSLSSGQSWHQEVSCSPNLTLLPALDIPSFRNFADIPRVMAITGSLCALSSFPASRELEGDGVHFRFEGLDGRWSEVWNAFESP